MIITKLLRVPIVAIFSAVFFISCGDISKKVDKKLEELQKKTESIDSLISKEVDKVLALDSLINRESETVKKLDSLLTDSKSKIDSVMNNVVNPLNR